MCPLSAVDLLWVWECGATRDAVQRALTLLEAAHPGVSEPALAQLCIGQRNALLLTLREWTFGPQMSSVAACPNCGQRLELDYSVADIRAEPDSLLGAEVQQAGPLALRTEGYEVQFRLPNSLDLSALVGHAELATARQTLLARCVLAARHNDVDVAAEQLPEGVVASIAAHMEQADPQADMRLSLACPACGCQWQAALDIALYFWNEIDAWAYRMLHDVHTLALTYGWREADILAMSPRRRQFYLDMVHQ
jgi:hypothetical protein